MLVDVSIAVIGIGMLVDVSEIWKEGLCEETDFSIRCDAFEWLLDAIGKAVVCIGSMGVLFSSFLHFSQRCSVILE